MINNIKNQHEEELIKKLQNTRIEESVGILSLKEWKERVKIFLETKSHNY